MKWKWLKSISGMLGLIRQSMSEGMDLDGSCPQRGEAEDLSAATNRLRKSISARTIWL